MMYDKYEFDEKDPRLTVEYVELCSWISRDTHVWLDQFRYDERGLVLKYADGDNIDVRTFEIKIVFDGNDLYAYSMRSNSISLQQNEDIGELQRIAGITHHVPILVFKCKHTNYFNWYIYQQSLYIDNSDFGAIFHYMFICGDMWFDVLSECEPKIYYHRFGAKLCNEEATKISKSYPFH